MSLLSLILPALLPPVADGLKTVFNKFFGGGGKPLNVDDQVKLETLQIEKMKALAALDTPGGTPSQWVVDLRASFRYIAAGLIIIFSYVGLFIYANILSQSNVDPNTVTFVGNLVDTLLQMSGSTFAFVFGDRVYFNLKNWMIENKKK